MSGTPANTEAKVLAKRGRMPTVILNCVIANKEGFVEHFMLEDCISNIEKLLINN